MGSSLLHLLLGEELGDMTECVLDDRRTLVAVSIEQIRTLKMMWYIYIRNDQGHRWTLPQSGRIIMDTGSGLRASSSSDKKMAASHQIWLWTSIRTMNVLSVR